MACLTSMPPSPRSRSQPRNAWPPSWSCGLPTPSSGRCSIPTCRRSGSPRPRGDWGGAGGRGRVAGVRARGPGVAEAVGVAPSPVFVAKAAELAAEWGNVSFEEGDGRALRFGDGDFDVVVCHTVLCHVPEPERVLAEAFRVLRPGGTLAACDGDYATTTVALAEGDPLQDCIEAVKAGFLNDPWLVRRLPALLRSVGFELRGSRSHGYLQTDQPAYMLTLVDRGADALASWGRIGPELCASLKAEARRRAEADEFYGFIGFASFIARKLG